MNYIIITGTSRGLGEAFAKRLISKENYLFCISRTQNQSIIDLAKKKNAQLHYFELDLTRLGQIESLMEDIASIIKDTPKSITLINNAGTVSPTRPIEKCESNEITENISLNLIAPMILTSEFIKLFEKYQTEKRIINISSGAGKKPYYGWSSYSTAKAGLDMFTKAVAIEQENQQNPVKIISIAPGVIDTQMQEEIRKLSINDFSNVDRFIEMKEKGQLLTADFVAERILAILDNENWQNGDVIDVRDFINKY